MSWYWQRIASNKVGRVAPPTRSRAVFECGTGCAWGVAPVDDRFQLGADAVEVHRGRGHHHVRPQELGVDFLHIVLLDALVPRVAGTALAAGAGVDVVVCYRDHFHLVALPLVRPSAQACARAWVLPLGRTLPTRIKTWLIRHFLLFLYHTLSPWVGQLGGISPAGGA